MRIHVVQKGDTLYKIAQKYNVDLDSLKKMNKQLSNPSDLKPGMKVKVPTAGVPVKKEKPVKEAPKGKKEAPKKLLPKEKPVKKTDPYQPKQDNFNPINEPLKPAMNVSAQVKPTDWSMPESSSNPTAAWSFHHPPNETPVNWPSMNEMPQVTGGWQNTNSMGWEPNGGPNINPMGWQSPYGAPNTNPMYPESFTPYGAPNANMFPEANFPPNGANMGQMESGFMPPLYEPNALPNQTMFNNVPMGPPPYPMNPYPGYWEPNALPNMAWPGNPNMMPMRDCGCGSDFYPNSLPQGMPNNEMLREQYAAQTPTQMPPYPPGQEFPGNMQSSYGWPAGDGMMPQWQPWPNDESNEDE